MIKLEHVVLPSPEQMEFVIEGMRNPMNSWEKSDSGFETAGYDIVGFNIGENDHSLMQRLSRGGPVHRKYMRMMLVMVRITAPLYWWKEFDTYKVGTVANSCSTMHKIQAKKFTLEDFSTEHLLNFTNNNFDERTIPTITVGFDGCEFSPFGSMRLIIEMLNDCRERYLAALKTEDETGIPAKDIWWQMIQLLPSSYNQTRNVMLNYETLANIYEWRKNHKLDEWIEFCTWIETLPYADLITGVIEEKEENENG